MLLTMRGWEDIVNEALVEPNGTWAPFGYYSYTSGRFGTGISTSGSSLSDGYWFYNLTVPKATLVVGQAMKFSLNAQTSCSPCVFRSGAGIQQLHARFNSTGNLVLYRGNPFAGGTQIAISSQIMQPNIWFFVESKATLADAGGTCQILVNGEVWIDFTGDTRLSGTDAEWTSVGSRSYAAVWIDDTYIDDSDFHGDVKVETLVPNANGTFSQFDGSDGNSVNNYALVDELPPSGSDYAQSAVLGERDTYGFTDLVTTQGVVKGVLVTAYGLKTDAGDASLKTITRLSGGTEHVSDAKSLSASMISLSEGVQLTDPAGAPWTISSVNSSEFGVEVG